MKRIDFVILCLGRTGSSFLASLLDSHSDVRCFGELFTAPPGPRGSFARSSHDDPADYLAGVVEPVTESVVGFKLPLNSIRAHERVLEIFEDRELRVIRLSRRNLLAVLVSRQLLKATGVSRSSRGSYGEAQVALDAKRTARVLGRMEEHERWLDSLAAGHPTFRIVYEDLVRGEGLEELQRFLGVEPRALQSPLEKLRTRSLDEAVSNWEEVAAALRGTPYEGFLTAGP